MSSPGALLVFANGNPFKALEIAKVFAGERGGIATITELALACLARPEHPAFKSQILSRSVVAFGSLAGDDYYAACLSHDSGLVEDGDGLRDAFKRAITAAPKTVTPWGGPNYGHLTPERFQALLAQPETHLIPVTCHPPTARAPRPRISELKLLGGQLPWLLGANAEAILADRRARLPCPPETEKNARHRWENGAVSAHCSHDGQVESLAFQNGEHALFSPLFFLQVARGDDQEAALKDLIFMAWSHHPIPFLVWRDRAEQVGEILIEPFWLYSWKLGRTDCFHPSEALPPSPMLFLLEMVKDASSNERLCAFRTIQDEHGFVGSDGEPLCLVEVVEVLGEHVLTEFMMDGPIFQETWELLMQQAPAGTQAIYFRRDRAQLIKDGTSCPHCSMPFADCLPVEFVRIRAQHEQRYLTADEMLADPEAHLRRIGALP